MKIAMKNFIVSLTALAWMALGTASLLAAEASDAPSATALKACLGKPGSDQCLDGIFREALEKQPPAQLLRSIQQYQDSDPALRLACHPVVHALGREIFRVKGNIHDSFSACDQTCHSGCYHGAVERFLRGDGPQEARARHVSQDELTRKASAACDPKTPRRIYFQCLHGLGHALMYFTENQLEKSLQACDTLPDEWSRSSCYGGVFMENVFSTAPEKRDVSASDYHYPCNRVDARYRGECYLMQTWRMEEMGLGTELLFDECAKAGPFETLCAQSIGRDLSNLARGGDRRAVAEKCGLARGEARLACIRGVAYALIDNTWDGRYALPFCAALREENDKRYCSETSEEYLRTFVD